MRPSLNQTKDCQNFTFFSVSIVPYAIPLELVSLFLAAALSLCFLGILRTAIWILPGLFFEGLLQLMSVSWISFFTVAYLLARHQKGFFDFRSWQKDRWALCFFLTGVSVGALLYPKPWPYFALGALIPLFFMKFYQSLRMPVALVQFFPAGFRPLLIAVTIGLGYWNWALG